LSLPRATTRSKGGRGRGGEHTANQTILVSRRGKKENSKWPGGVRRGERETLKRGDLSNKKPLTEPKTGRKEVCDFQPDLKKEREAERLK